MTGGKINGTINIVRSTKGCLTCNLLAWGCQNLTTYNVTVIIVTWKLLSVGERQLPFLYDRNVGILKKLFPKIQFICATHSPFIIQSLKEGELITLDHPLESDYSGEGIEDIAEDVMGVEMPQYSEKKRKMYEAAQNYLKALEQAESQEDLDALRNEMNRLEAVYSENPAYLALIEQENLVKEQEVKDNEAGK